MLSVDEEVCEVCVWGLLQAVSKDMQHIAASNLLQFLFMSFMFLGLLCVLLNVAVGLCKFTSKVNLFAAIVYKLLL